MNLLSTISSAERKIPGTSKVVSKMQKIRNNSSSKIRNIAGKTGNKFGSLRNSATGTLSTASSKLSNQGSKALNYTSNLTDKGSSQIIRFLSEGFNGSKKFANRLSQKYMKGSGLKRRNTKRNKKSKSKKRNKLKKRNKHNK